MSQSKVTWPVNNLQDSDSTRNIVLHACLNVIVKDGKFLHLYFFNAILLWLEIDGIIRSVKFYTVSLLH